MVSCDELLEYEWTEDVSAVASLVVVAVKDWPYERL